MSASSTKNVQKSSEKKAKRVSPSRHDPTLGRYFQELSEHSVLSSDEEVRQAKALAQMEIDRWSVVLRDPVLVAEIHPHLMRLLAQLDSGDNSEKTEHAAECLAKLKRSAARLCKSASRGPTQRTLKRYEELCREVGAGVHELDLKRDFINAAHGVVIASDPKRETRVCHRQLVRECKSIAGRVQAAKHAFIRANLRLVVSIARRYDRGQMPLIDLIQEGNLGLIKAVERFDYRRGFRFNTYASWWIRHAIGRALADKGQAVRVPVHALDAQQRLGKAVEAISLKLGRPPTEAELVKETGIDKRKLARVQKHKVAPIASLDREISSADNRRYVDLLPDENTKNPFESTMLAAWQKNMDAVMEVLTPMERTIIRWRYGLDSRGEEMTLKEIGDFYSLSRERIRQLQEQALRKLRRRLSLDAA